MLDDTLKEINKQGMCVIEVERWDGSTAVTYLINLKENIIEKKQVNIGCEDFDIIKKVNTSNLEKLLSQYPDFDIADIDDDDYIFETEYNLIRLQDINE